MKWILLLSNFYRLILSWIPKDLKKKKKNVRGTPTIMRVCTLRYNNLYFYNIALFLKF